MSNYSFNVVTIIFSTQTRPKCEFSTLFPTHSLIMFCEAFPASVMTHTTVPTRDPERRKKWFSLPWGTAHNNHWSRTELFSAFSELIPPTGGCCFSASVLEMVLLLLVFSIPWLTLRSLVCCSVCFTIQMSSYLYFAECVFACGVFCFSLCAHVCGCVR